MSDEGHDPTPGENPETQDTKRNPPANSGWRLRNWRLRSKIAAVLLVPTLTALALGGLRVVSEVHNADAFRATVRQVDVARQTTSVIHEVQREGIQVVAYLAAGRPPDRAPTVEQLQRANTAIADLHTAADQLEFRDPATRERYQRALQRLDGLTALRVVVNDGVYPDVAAYASYTSIVDALVQLGREVTAEVTDQSLSRAATAVQAVTQAKEHAAQQDALLQIAAGHSAFRPRQLDQTREEDASFAASVADFLAVATPQERQFYMDTVSGPDVDARQRIKQDALIQAGLGAPLAIPASQLAGADSTNITLLRKVEDHLLGSLRDQASVLADAALASATRDAALVLAALLVALGLMLVVVLSLLNPLRVLRTEALAVANTRLPATVRRILADPDPVAAAKNAVEPVSVHTREEIGQVARSFDAVHEQAVRMATEQALLRDSVNAIFVNLSRRSQSLVQRQLAVIDRLELHEQDPDQLASLFELDHFATRIRRNSENLLILSGSGLGARLHRPVSVGELIGAAVSEVEHYARVDVGKMADAMVQGHVASDLIHLVAELLDNAAVFSQPDTRIRIISARRRAGELAIQISDEGMGMTERDLAEANARLADPPDIDVSVSRRMGLYVVARLAKRHDIAVRLRSSEFLDRGTRAIISIPAQLIAADGDGPRAARPVADRARVGPRRGRAARDAVRPSATAQFDVWQATASAGTPVADVAAPVAPVDVDPVTERLPIYEDLLSRWFTDDPRHDAPPVAERAAPEPEPANTVPANTMPAEPEPVEPKSQPQPDWQSPGDEGWRAAGALLTAPPPAEITATGLPKRVPKAQLMPGSAAPQQEQQPKATGPGPAARAVRSRLSGFQQGRRRGRIPAAADQRTSDVRSAESFSEEAQ
ncbi:HAMP domain-containing protein [Solihabitans fulvus]|uniref:histidine kinase n=1 Tax=Solihabitans fulvus TaxID=1892852 RepID=A0A5B2WA32_9PSEU|nr:nitrate- and nitrite sensing domain-containing protein [Solihabitans fulvus]KAA2248863.1 HAMP domain-containing protein [Solihabitans fulvus]